MINSDVRARCANTRKLRVACMQYLVLCQKQGKGVPRISDVCKMVSIAMGKKVTPQQLRRAMEGVGVNISARRKAGIEAIVLNCYQVLGPATTNKTIMYELEDKGYPLSEFITAHYAKQVRKDNNIKRVYKKDIQNDKT